jgi:hypothetical protein
MVNSPAIGTPRLLPIRQTACGTRAREKSTLPLAGNWYGTTLRIFDPALDAWRIYWIDPATNTYRQQLGRKQGADIVQEGTTETGTLSRWSFTEIKQGSFHWKGEASFDKGASWRLLVEVFARRVPGQGG